jgi:hypothetical protein
VKPRKYLSSLTLDNGHVTDLVFSEFPVVPTVEPNPLLTALIVVSALAVVEAVLIAYLSIQLCA